MRQMLGYAKKEAEGGDDMKAFWEVFSSIKGYFSFMMILFIAALALGFAFSEQLEATLQNELQGLKQIKEMAEKQDNPTLFLLGFIFLNNTLKAAAVILLGIGFGIVPLFFLILNALLVGFLLRFLELQGQNPVELFLYGILPHGVLELPAIIFASALGLKLGSIAWRRFLGLFWDEEKRGAVAEWKFYFNRMGATLLTLSGVLLVAACIEAYVTSAIMDRFLQ
jgi:stage II sporulation protein M